MNSKTRIRPERADDAVAIHDVLVAAFHGISHAAGDEAEIVEALRVRNALTVSLVAESRGTVVGQIAFSPARLASGVTGWSALGPVAVHPDHQRRGIGSRLVHEGLEAIYALGTAGCILTGDPNFFSRFGFEKAPRNLPSDEPSALFMVKVFRRP